MILELPARLRAQLAAEARDAFPRECCGLIEGVIDDVILRQAQGEASNNALTLSLSKGEPKLAARATALHPMPNLASKPDRFEIDPGAHIALLRALRGTDRAVIGCYHSHPHGRPELSERDRAQAIDKGFLWLIAALHSDAVEGPQLAAFISTGFAFTPVPLEPASLDRLAAPPV